jgi:hypothetical protein
MKLSFLVTLAVSTSCILASVLMAQEPQMFRYQGRILDNDALVSGNLDFSFKLYDTPTGGTSLYEDTASITVVDGLYSTMIGDDMTSGGDLGDALNNPAVYLEIEVGGETLTPRERIVSVPYAMNGLPSGSVVLSASNPNAALEAKGYSLVYSDVNSPEDWIVALEDELVIPFSSSSYQTEMVTFGAYVGFYNEGSSSTEGSNPFHYSQDGIFWNESTPPFNLPNAMYGDVSVELNANLYVVRSNGAADGGPSLRVATTSNGADWTELSVSLPVSINFSSSSFELEAYANQIWLFGSSPTGPLLLKSSDGATWDAVATPAWETSADGVETVSTPERLVVLAFLSDGTYVWSTTDGSTWTQSSEVIPSGGSTYGVEMAYANGALWTFGTPEGGTFQALYKSTDWGNSWSQVTTNLPSIQNAYNPKLMSLAPSPGLLFALGNSDSGNTTGTFISKDGSDWSRVSSANLAYSMYGGRVDVSSTGKFWVSQSLNYGGSHVLYSIGGPLRNGRFFYYQKD